MGFVEDHRSSRAGRADYGASDKNSVLMIAYHYPPCRGSSGLQRTLSFSRYLPSFGWQPLVLTAKSNAYPEIGDDQIGDVPASVVVRRAFALDTARHLAVRGHYIGWMALPDRWVSWLLAAVPLGLRLIREYKPRVLWSTHPIPTAHLIGFILKRLTGLPWVADFRDPMTEIDPINQRRFPEDRAIWNARSRVERITLEHCSRAVFVAPTTLRMYRERYQQIPANHWVTIYNGYNEDDFVAAEKSAIRASASHGCIRLVHSGLLYVTHRDPSAFFSALARLRQMGTISPTTLQVILRASGNENYYKRLIQDKNLGELVSLKPGIPYREALAEMVGAHGLLIFQGQETNANIPAKLYEYLRARVPIFALADTEGDTASVLNAAGVGTIVPMNSVELIIDGLIIFLQQVRAGTAPIPPLEEIKKHSRLARTGELAKLFDSLAATPCVPESCSRSTTG